MKLLGVELPKIFANLCTPAQVYVILGVIAHVAYLFGMFSKNNSVVEAEPEGDGIHQYTAGGLFINVFFTIVWIWLLNYICQYKYGKKIAWFIVLLPFFFMGLMLIGMLCAISFITLQTSKNRELHKKLKEKENVYDKQSNQPSDQLKNQPMKKPTSELLR